MFLRGILTTLALFSFVTFGTATLPIYDEDNTNTLKQIEESVNNNADENTSELADTLSVTADEIIETAMKYLGRPYRYGSAGPKVFDCSGFTSFVFKNSNISLSRASRTQYTQGTPVKRNDLRVGDLVFFTSPRSGHSVGHVGIVSKVEEDGNFHFIHAARRGVTVDNFASASYYHRRYVGARRVLDEN